MQLLLKYPGQQITDSFCGAPCADLLRLDLRKAPTPAEKQKRLKDFQGRLQFVIDVQHEGRKLALVVPADGERDSRDFQLHFRFFQRVEGTFRLSPGSGLHGIQVRIFENGSRAPRLTQSLTMS